jgi:hypothetical protein
MLDKQDAKEQNKTKQLQLNLGQLVFFDYSK